MFSNKIYIFLYQKVKVKKYLLLFVSLFPFFNFSFFFLMFFLLSLAISSNFQVACIFFKKIYTFFVFKESTLQYLEKIQVQIIFFRKRAVVKIYWTSNSKSPLSNFVASFSYTSQKYYAYFFQFLSLIDGTNIKTTAHLLDPFKTRCVFIDRNSIFAD